jgi:glucose/arabinose dehydrogenase
MNINAALLGMPVVSFLLLVLASACGGGGVDNLQATASPPPTLSPSPPFGLQSQVVVNADRPTALTFAPDGRIFFAEQYSGNIRVVSADGKLQSDPFATLEVANWVPLDWGLTGLAVDPDFATNHYLYAFYTSAVEQGAVPIGKPMLVRFTDQNGHGANQTTIVGDLPQTFKDHQGLKANGKIHFGRDGLLYMTVGDYDYGKAAGPDGKPPGTDLSTPLGKMLRINKDGTVPSDNPFAGRSGVDPRIFAYGFSNAFEFTIDPANDRIYGTDGDASCEELVQITVGGNYGWPDVGEFPFSDCYAGRQVKPIHLFALEGMKAGEFLSGVVTAGLAFVSASKYPLVGDGLLACESKTGYLQQLTLNQGTGTRDQVTEGRPLVYDCKRGVARNSDGTIYYSNDTELRVLVPGKP